MLLYGSCSLSFSSSDYFVQARHNRWTLSTAVTWQDSRDSLEVVSKQTWKETKAGDWKTSLAEQECEGDTFPIFSLWSNAPLSRGVRIISPSFPAQRPGHPNANKTFLVLSTTSLLKPTRVFSDCRQGPQLGIKRHKDMCFPFTYFSFCMDTAQCSHTYSPLSSMSSCHQKIKKKKTNPELEAVHFRGNAPTNSCTHSDGGNVCGLPTLWQALPSITSFIISPSNLWRREHLIHFKTCQLGPSNVKRKHYIPMFGH